MTPEEQAKREYREKRDQAMRELREHIAKVDAKAAAKGYVPPPPVPADSVEPLEEIETEELLQKPFVRFIKTVQDAPEGECQDFVVRRRLGDYSCLDNKIEQDAEETGCRSYIVLNEGDQYCVWRMPR